MAKGKVVVLVAFCAALGVSIAVQLVSGSENSKTTTKKLPPGGNPEKLAAISGEFRGITLPLHSGWDEHPYEKYIDEIAATGANTVAFVLAAYQENAGSTSIFVDLRKVPSDVRLKKIIKHAKDKGLYVSLMPIVLLENPRDGEWRGKINPEKGNWDAWWADYEEYIMRYVYIAGETGVDIFMVGSELISTETQTDRWRELIKKVRGSYTGLLAYSANWDHYKPVKYWDALDIVGMTTYYDLTDGGKEPTMERLMEEWATIRKQVLEWQKTVNRPILFTEVGWPNQTTCAQYPWDYTRATDKPKPQLQADCFKAFFRTWTDEPAMAGYLVWEWRSWEQQPTGPDDTSYVPVGKPSLAVIKEYLNRPSPKTASRPAAPHSGPVEAAAPAKPADDEPADAPADGEDES